MKYRRRISLFFLFFSFLFSGNVFGQYDADATPYSKTSKQERLEIAVQAFDDIQKGFLIVRLVSGDKKLKALDRLINSPEVSDSKKISLKKMRKSTVEDTRDVNRKLHDAFVEKYSFSDVLFMYDTSMYNLTAGRQSGFFLDDNLEVDPGISLNDRPYHVVRYGRKFNSGRVAKNLYVMDKNYNDLIGPFPNSQGWFNILASGLFFTPRETDVFFNRMVESFHGRIEKSYHKLKMKGKMPD